MSNLVVHHLGGAWGLPSVSPFCLKLDAWLQITGIPHTAVVDATPFAAPKGKAPWIEHDGMKLGDSSFIIDYLTKRVGIDPDAGLSPADQGTARALRAMIEENLYWVMVHDRWVVEENWRRFKPIVLGGVPAPMRMIVAPMARRGVKAQLKGHGMGHHTQGEIHDIGRRDLSAIEAILGSKPFLLGDAPTGIDATAYGLLANILYPADIKSPLQDHIRAHPTLAGYVDRFRARFYA